MKVFLVVDGTRFPCDVPAGKRYVWLRGTKPGPCGCGPCAIVGGEQRASADDRAWEADAFCCACKKPIGVLRAEVDTLFGVTEDRAVLCGRPRVYG